MTISFQPKIQPKIQSKFIKNHVNSCEIQSKNELVFPLSFEGWMLSE